MAATAAKALRRIVVLMGGQSAERDVSLNTGETVALRLASRGHRVRPVVIHADGRWEVAAVRGGEGLAASARAWFSGAGHCVEAALAELRRDQTEVIFNALHGPGGEDGTVQGLFEIFGLPYTGPDVTAAALAMDKRLTKEVLRAQGIATPRSFFVGPGCPRNGPAGAGAIDWESILAAGRARFPFPWILKPNCLGSSVGVLKVKDAEAFLAQAGECERFLPWAASLEHSARPGELLVEEFIPGRELTCGVVALDTARPVALPPIEIRPREAVFFDYQAKYTPGATEEICPAPVSAAMTRRIQELAVRVHEAVRAAPLSRTDFILDAGGELQVLEINTIPGMTATSLIPLSAGKAGMDLGEMFEGMVEHALRRAGKS